MLNFFDQLEQVLFAQKTEDKLKMFKQFYAEYKAGMLLFEAKSSKLDLQTPSYSAFCTIVPPQNVPKRKNLTTKEGQQYLLHAIAHIEYSAIDLALDAAYRFENMPKEYYDDWLEVADDEVRHFEMLHKLLLELGCSYGDIEVHNSLFEAMQRTQHSLLERMAIVPRYLEANGLDATPMILTKLQKLPQNSMLEKVMQALHVILEEEISHVQKGDRWFSYACDAEQKDKTVYFEIIEKYYPVWMAKSKTLNIDARKAAGFTCKELSSMAHKDLCI